MLALVCGTDAGQKSNYSYTKLILVFDFLEALTNIDCIKLKIGNFYPLLQRDSRITL